MSVKERLAEASATLPCCCGGRAGRAAAVARSRSRNIDAQLRADHRRLQRQIKLLLLGAGESGKSTFLKQMKIIHGVQFDRQQLCEFRQIIYGNIIRGMRVLVDANRKLGLSLADDRNRLYGDQLLLLDDVSVVTEHNFADFGSMLRSLWTDGGIQAAFERRSEYQITDSVAYFFENLSRIAVRDYMPSQQDILYCRKTTKGIIEFPLVIEHVPFLFVDVGGQRTQRQKWLGCFDSVTAILFLASASEFDQALVEDRRVNRLEESRTIFDAIVNNVTFSGVSFILFLNKMDLLEEKIVKRRVDIRKFFPDFSNAEEVRRIVEKFNGDPHSVSDVKNFILYLFVVKQRLQRQQLYHHFTTAVDTKNIRYVFTSVKETILRKNLDALMLQ